MGTWSEDPLGNDDAADFVNELISADSFEPVIATIQDTLDRGETYLEMPDAARGIAAVEVLARRRQQSAAKAVDADGLNEWLAKFVDPPKSTLLEDAVRLLDRVIADRSEIRELWEESGEYAVWADQIRHLRTRLM